MAFLRGYIMRDARVCNGVCRRVRLLLFRVLFNGAGR